MGANVLKENAFYFSFFMFSKNLLPGKLSDIHRSGRITDIAEGMNEGKPLGK